MRTFQRARLWLILILFVPSISHAQQASKIEDDSTTVMTDSNLCIGYAYSNDKDYDAALHYYASGLATEERRPAPDHQKIATYCHLMGTACLEKGDFERSLDFFTRALSIYKSNFAGNQAIIAATHFYVGKSYYQQGEYGKALVHYNKAFKIRKKLFGADDLDVRITCRVIGIAFIAKGEDKRGLTYFSKSDLANSDAYDQITIINEYGRQALLRMKYKEAINLFKLSLTILEKSNLPETEFKSLIRAAIYHYLGMAYAANPQMRNFTASLCLKKKN